MSQNLDEKEIDKVAAFLEKTKKAPKVPKTLEERIAWARARGYDCIVQCPKCGRTQYLEFKNGLKNGWSTCCGGLTMPIIWQEANIDKAVKETIDSQTGGTT